MLGSAQCLRIEDYGGRGGGEGLMARGPYTKSVPSLVSSLNFWFVVLNSSRDQHVALNHVQVFQSGCQRETAG